MKQIYLIITFSLFSLIGFSQTMEITGNISDASGLPLPGVTIIQVSTNNGAITDFDGYFTVKGIKIGDQLKFSYLGFREKTVTIKTKNSLVITLDEDQESLDEVVIVGYGTQTKKEITGAVSVVSSQTIEELAPTRIEQALQGQVSGVNITTQSGAPGSASNIRIRGISYL